MKNIKAIIFDAYGTLFDVNSAAEKCKDKIGDKWEGFANYWRTTQLEYTWLRSLMNRHKNFWQVTEDSLDKSMKAFEIDSSMRNELLDLYKKLSTFPEVKEVLNNLKKKNYKLAILSNGTPALLNELVKNNNLDTDNFDEGQQTLARHLIGYQPRQYLEDLGMDENSQYKFYQGFIREKGTITSITKLLNAQFRSGEENTYNVFEELY